MSLISYFCISAYNIGMRLKNKIIWKLIVIILCFLCILFLALFSRRKDDNTQYMNLREERLLKENERASIRDARQSTKTVEKTQDQEPQEGQSGAETESEDKVIQVLIKTDDYSSYEHSSLQFTIRGDYRITGGEEASLKSGETVTVERDSPYFRDGSFRIEPLEENNQLTLLSVSRGQGNPSYQGAFTIYQEEAGLRIVNELPVETYLRGVVPSEMPSSYEMEALKAQAVCARTYAYVQLGENKLKDLGAQVDDSVSFQVYQNSGTNERTDEAVAATRGEILCQNGSPIDAYYFSTSHGKTSTDEVWEASAPAAYLKSVVCEYDKEEPWYRWSVTFSKEQLLKGIQSSYPEITDLSSLEILEVGEGDAVLSMGINSPKETVTVQNEYTIRQILAPRGLKITRQDGSVVDGGSLLPSAYFTLEELREGEELKGYTIHGGGYGHGVGLSQNGAQHMAQEGNGYKEILEYFYNGVTLNRAGEAQ